ncbi:wu:fc21g02 isoform X2 [Danio rerio]|nr:wu:fc21g02 precursor [Danio rerio]XP_005160326.1 uncharacterized protein wu:fc21g02 isoform X2 [Danio rerio]|eukprot:XP_005160325.1 uncharacterized protein wu:fc21g02 isoform X2 [Danio rerio]
MQIVWPFLAAAFCAVSVSAVSTYRKAIDHGNQLILELPERTDKLEFASADETEHYIIWENRLTAWYSRTKKGHVTSTNNGWTFKIQQATFDDEGTYLVRNIFGSAISSYTVKVQTNTDTIPRIAGETLKIPLRGLKMSNVTLRFYDNDSAITLVENGVPVGKNYRDYYNRLKVYLNSIEVVNVNTSDLGRYELTDKKGRLISSNTMILVDHHPFTPNLGLLAILLVGVPGGICYCCRRRLCKCCRTSKSNTHSATSPNSEPVSIPCNVIDPSINPGGMPQSPLYPAVPQPGVSPGHPSNWNQPAPPYHPYTHEGYNPVNVPQNPVYPPQSAPTHPPQWNDPASQNNPFPNQGFNPGNVPQNPLYPPQSGPTYTEPASQYNPSPAMNYSSPGPETTGMTTNDPPQTAPLLAPQPEGYRSALDSLSMNMLSTSDSGVQFDINKGKSTSNNFL